MTLREVRDKIKIARAMASGDLSDIDPESLENLAVGASASMGHIEPNNDTAIFAEDFIGGSLNEGIYKKMILKMIIDRANKNPKAIEDIFETWRTKLNDRWAKNHGIGHLDDKNEDVEVTTPFTSDNQ